MIKTIATNLLVGTILAGSYAAIPEQDFSRSYTEADIMEGRPNAKGSPAWVLERHEDTCWRKGDTPLAPLPGHAIVQVGDRTLYTGKHSLVDAAFSDVLGERDWIRGEVVALCL